MEIVEWKYIYTVHELVVRARQLASVAQLVRALSEIAGPQVQFLPGAVNLHFLLLFLVWSIKCI